MKYLYTFILSITALAVAAQAQTVTTTVNTPIATTTVQMPLPTKTVKTVTDAKVNAEIIASSSTKVVKGAPFSADGISESVQVLGDGNKITRSSTTKMFRDGEGRFRREGGASTGGSGFTYTTLGSGMVSLYGMQDTISIFDPVEGVRYVLNPTDKTARRFEVKNALVEGTVYINGQTLSPAVKAQVEANAINKTNVVVMPNMATGTMSGGKTESLGTKLIEGVEAEGTRTVTTIEAGKIGNERAIEIVYERWYSKELDLIVYSRHYDPRFGEQIYRLDNVNRGEPDRSLFSVPTDYKVVAESQYKVYTTTTTAPKQ